MEYERGLDALRAQLQGTNWYSYLATLELRLKENQDRESLYGYSQAIKTERAEIIHSLNRLAIEILGLSFTDLVKGHFPEAGLRSTRDLILVRQLGVEPSSTGIKPPVQSRLQELPFNQLSWEQFEALCAALVEVQPVRIDCHLYGIQGDVQKGIDIVSTQRGAGEKQETWVYQCKRYKNFTPSMAMKALHKMKCYSEANYRVLMLSIPAKAALRQAVEKKANTFLWDSRDIARKLKYYPKIVEDFFGPQWRVAFCGQPPELDH